MNSLACRAADLIGKLAGLLFYPCLCICVFFHQLINGDSNIRCICLSSACLDNIKMVYGDDSTELSNFKRVIREESNKLEASKNQQDKLLDT
jgi:hypothetical protein